MGNMIASMNQVSKTENRSPKNVGSSPNFNIKSTSPQHQKRGLSSFVEKTEIIIRKHRGSS